MDEPPAKRPKRSDSTATWNKEDKEDSRPKSGGRDADHRSLYRNDREGDRRKRSRSRGPHEKRRDGSVTRDKPYRERDHDRERGPRDREANGGIQRHRSKSRDRHRGQRGTWKSAVDRGTGSRDSDHRSERSHRRSRSRSPYKSGSSTSARTRSPPRRTDHDRSRPQERGRVAAVDGSNPHPRAEAADKEASVGDGGRMAVDEEDEEALLKKMMGFTTFKTTQNTKVPGNQIYGVRKEKKTEYRQYMNRVGGFNRPLSPSR